MAKETPTLQDIESAINALPIEMPTEIHDTDKRKEIDPAENVLSICKTILQEVHQMSARFSIMENSIIPLLNGKSLISTNRKTDMVDKIEENRVFCVANRLPLKNLNDLNIFEEKLDDIEFMKIAVNTRIIYYLNQI